MKRNASKRDERHGQSRHRPTKVLEFVKLILRPQKSQPNDIKLHLPFETKMSTIDSFNQFKKKSFL